jgi:V/A-type H+-transporting ATPase subunit D
MREEPILPTRSDLLAGQRRLERVSKGAELLRRKREALMAEIVRHARPASDARALIREQATQAYALLASALGVEGLTGLTAIAWPARDFTLRLREAQVWGIPVVEIVDRPLFHRTLEARGLPPTAIGPAAAAAATGFETLTDELLAAAPRELLLQRLGTALTRTSRQVNTLEQRVAPRLRQQIGRARRMLEEREREEHVRLGWLIRAHQLP